MLRAASCFLLSSRPHGVCCHHSSEEASTTTTPLLVVCGFITLPLLKVVAVTNLGRKFENQQGHDDAADDDEEEEEEEEEDRSAPGAGFVRSCLAYLLRWRLWFRLSLRTRFSRCGMRRCDSSSSRGQRRRGDERDGEGKVWSRYKGENRSSPIL